MKSFIPRPRKFEFVPIQTVQDPEVYKNFRDYEVNAFLAQHFGGGIDKSLRWGYQMDAACVQEQEEQLKNMLAGVPGSMVTSYWETHDGRWLRVITHNEPVIGLVCSITGGLVTEPVEVV